MTTTSYPMFHSPRRAPRLSRRLVGLEGISRPLRFTEGRLTNGAGPVDLHIDLSGHLVLPGLINAHDHLHMNNIPPLPHSRPFPNSYAWMEAFQPFFWHPAVIAARAVPMAARQWHGALKNILSGATMVAHHDPLDPAFTDPAFPTQVLQEYGWCHSPGLAAGASPRTSLRYGPSLLESYHATGSTKPWFIHLAEGVDEVAARELRELDALGCLGSSAVLVHGVGLSEDDMSRVIERGAGVVWCPGSNQALFGRTLNPRRLYDAGRLALGTDSRLTGTRDLLEELKMAARCSDLRPAELLDLVTGAAARVLRRPDAGGLAAGQSADLLIVRDTGLEPGAALLALSRSQIRAVVRGGVPVIADTDFTDWFAEFEVPTAHVRLDGRLKLIAADALGPAGAVDLEPGLEVEPVNHLARAAEPEVMNV